MSLVYISKAGLLYRLAYGRLKPEQQPIETVDLCGTVWLAAGHVMYLVVITVAAIGSLAFMGSLVFIPAAIVAIFGMFSQLTEPTFWQLHVGDQLMLSGVICIIILAFLAESIAFWITISQPWQRAEMRALFKAYWQAKKARYCPTLTVV